jgi:hypothetical protein
LVQRFLWTLTMQMLKTNWPAEAPCSLSSSAGIRVVSSAFQTVYHSHIKAHNFHHVAKLPLFACAVQNK